MEAIGQLTGGIAHDFNNLLAGVMGSLELMNNRIKQGRGNEVARYIAAAQESSKRAAALTQRLLAFSRRQTLSPAQTDVNRLVQSMENLIRSTIGPSIEVHVAAAGDLWMTEVDPNQLEIALLNLCLNSRDAMPTGGRLTIATSNFLVDARMAREGELTVGEYVSLSVSDTGSGMTPDVMARAFDPFFTTKTLGSGTGLGLSMIYGFVKQSGGHVRLYSEVNRGATATIYLPRLMSKSDIVQAQSSSMTEPRSMIGGRVLVVDDEAMVRMLVREVLDDFGFTSLEAGDGAAALEILRSDASVDLLVTDVGMPNMNGRQLADAARRLRPGLKVLFITGYAENAVINHGHLGVGMQILTKPFLMEALGNKVRDMLGTKAIISKGTESNRRRRRSRGAGGAAIDMILLPVTCPICGLESMTAFPVQVVAIALSRWNNMALYASCHEGSWSASPSEIAKIRDFLGSEWVKAHHQPERP